jgi:uncharacterized protein YbjT (DUF2867 family)
MNKTTILITSASGNTSNAAARHLLARVDKDKVNVRVGARSKDRIQDLIQKGAEYVKFDFFDKNSIVEALKVSITRRNLIKKILEIIKNKYLRQLFKINAYSAGS